MRRSCFVYVESKMIFVIVFVMFVCNLQLQSECQPLNEIENTIEIKFPRPILHKSSVTINGTLNVTATTLRATIRGNESEKEQCPIEIKPQQNIIVIGGSGSSPYEFDTGDKEVINFTLKILAYSNSDESMSLHSQFNGDESGIQDLNVPCMFKSFSSVDRIIFEGFKHIRRLTFEYNDEDEGKTTSK